MTYLEEFPRYGIKVSYVTGPFLEVIRQHGVDLKVKKTRHICQAITEITSAHQSSYCEMLLQQDATADIVSDTPQAFISHAHDLLFEDLLSALSWHFRNEPEAYVWLDLFDINQHQPIRWTFEWLSTAFRSNVAGIGRTVMVMSPWNNPLPYTRSWCIYETLVTVQAGGKFEMAMSKSDEADFLENIKRDANGSIDRLLATVRSEKSQCSVPSDREYIFAAIQETVGFLKLDSMVFERYREWVIEVTQQALDTCCRHSSTENTEEQREREQNKLTLFCALGNLYGGQGKHEEAIRYKTQALEEVERIHGNEHPDTLRAMNNLANSLQKHGLYEKAAELYRSCLNRRQTIFGCDHRETLRAMNNLANSLRRLGQNQEAERLYRTCLEKRSILLGTDHAETLRTMNNLAVSLQAQGSYGQAAELFRSCLDKKKSALGEGHPETLRTTSCLASVLQSQGLYHESAKLFRECMEKRQSILGKDHQEVLRDMHGLATSLRYLGRVGEAKELFRSCMDMQKAVLGIKHPETLQTMYELSVSLLCQLDTSSEPKHLVKEKEEAEELLRFCLEKQTEVLGEDHHSTRETRHLLTKGLH